MRLTITEIIIVLAIFVVTCLLMGSALSRAQAQVKAQANIENLTKDQIAQKERDDLEIKRLCEIDGYHYFAIPKPPFTNMLAPILEAK